MVEASAFVRHQACQWKAKSDAHKKQSERHQHNEGGVNDRCYCSVFRPLLLIVRIAQRGTILELRSSLLVIAQPQQLVESKAWDSTYKISNDPVRCLKTRCRLVSNPTTVTMADRTWLSTVLILQCAGQAKRWFLGQPKAEKNCPTHCSSGWRCETRGTSSEVGGSS